MERGHARLSALRGGADSMDHHAHQHENEEIVARFHAEKQVATSRQAEEKQVGSLRAEEEMVAALQAEERKVAASLEVEQKKLAALQAEKQEVREMQAEEKKGGGSLAQMAERAGAEKALPKEVTEFLETAERAGEAEAEAEVASKEGTEGESQEAHLDAETEKLLEDEITKLVLENTHKKETTSEKTGEPKPAERKSEPAQTNNADVSSQAQPPAASKPASPSQAATPAPAPLMSMEILPYVVLPAAIILISIASGIRASPALFKKATELIRSKATWDYAKPFLWVIGGWAFSNWLALAAHKRFLEWMMVDRTTAMFLQGIVKWTTLAFACSLIIRGLGFRTGGLDALLASSGIALGFASQNVLQNLAAGFIILLFRPFKVGDRISISGKTATVTGVGILETKLITDSGLLIAYPNGKIYENVVENLTAHGMRRVEVALEVSVFADAPTTRRT
eukprot:CAMPEP_0181344858 /NCGR_PEP_ID=MMETSP1101-20121128/32426_1 /TAXON_ID=46948 /ORGANISM="Rhodomonas abbreviata, Strain Caron Lab Isolate" /LENGTH=453 /DNA_ID=CAMNT_0023456747 /DNA_START=247 /DNA_END=1605 /DNA_ORIENTATION=-